MPTDSTLDNTTLRVGGVPEHFNLPWRLGIENGSFQSAGVDVQYRDYPGGTGALTQALRDDELDVAVVLTEGCVADILNGNPARIVKTYVQSPLIWGIHVEADSSIKSIDEVSGKRYAISRFGSGSHLMAIVDAAERGWPTDDLQFVVVKNLDGARAALAAGEADVFFWERFTTSPLVAGGEFRRLTDRETPWPAFVICVRNEVLANNPDAIQAMLSVINEQAGQLMNHPQAIDMISKRYSLASDQVEAWFAQTKWSTDHVIPTAAVEAAIAYLQRLELTDNGSAGPADVWHSVA